MKPLRTALGRAASFQVVQMMTRLVQWGKKTQVSLTLIVSGWLSATSLEEYIATDISIETCGSLSDAEIVEMVRPSEPSHETEVDDDDAAIIQALIALVNDPEPEHPLRADLAEEYSKDRKKFLKNAEEFTKKHSEKRPPD
ncbi:hypothetical protein HPB51_021381 [Rhipicephalus microplus]|uniref:Uncharacterized protein n=1 Tax=Rhipicephalus microplus TaxID=6941 RepID=A0A9J6F7L6_RHIMP|nr:hypothetical protein HPB51_021381 [Rhipicephalus microplus]